MIKTHVCIKESSQTVLFCVRAHAICASLFPRRPADFKSARRQTTWLDTIVGSRLASKG